MLKLLCSTLEMAASEMIHQKRAHPWQVLGLLQKGGTVQGEGQWKGSAASQQQSAVLEILSALLISPNFSVRIQMCSQQRDDFST